MSFCNPVDSVAPSEDFSQTHFSGSYLFSAPQEVDHWCQSVPYGGEDLPLTPPDTASECSFTEHKDMNPRWTKAPAMEQSWTTEHGSLDHSTYVQQPAAGQWPSSGDVNATEPRSQNMVAPSWMNSFHGSVDMGFSPVSSYECQTSQSLDSYANQDLSVLPPNLDLSFVEPNWNSTTDSAVMYSDNLNASHAPAGSGLLSPTYTEASASATRPAYSHQPMQDFGHDVQSLHSFAPTPVSVGPTSDARLDSFACPMQRAHRPYQFTGQDHTNAVRGSSGNYSGFSASQGPSSVASTSALRTQASFQSPDVGFQSAQYAPGRYYTSGQYQDGYRSHEPVEQMPAEASYQYDMPAVPAPASKPASNSSHASKPVTDSTETTDEGRYRNHPLYSQKPQADGLYHCPFAGEDPNCGHKPTKLKCNYDKFIDSHLKPFRCKIESCSKEKFSSTACLLRHEREAHGMHGHGDRPHLCYYPGCERGIPGNGFPRRYNLFDHMKRVHDHKETIAETAKAEKDERKAASRKRKATESPPAGGPAPKMSRAAAVAPQPVPQPMGPVVQNDPVPFNLRMPAQPRKFQQEKRTIYSQWANQRELLARQMEFVQSPDDEANLHRLSQNVAEFRRLSDEARRG